MVLTQPYSLILVILLFCVFFIPFKFSVTEWYGWKIFSGFLNSSFLPFSILFFPLLFFYIVSAQFVLKICKFICFTFISYLFNQHSLRWFLSFFWKITNNSWNSCVERLKIKILFIYTIIINMNIFWISVSV